MKMKFRSLPLAACAIICLQSAAAVRGVDQIFTNEKFVTVDDRFRIAQALAVRGERIGAVGADAEIEKLKSATTQVIDLKRRTVFTTNLVSTVRED
jgi:hypothetical protein